MEDVAGLKAWDGDVSAIFELAPSVEPRYSTIANLLGSYPANEDGRDALPLPPVRLKCMVSRSGKSGKTTYIPYQTWADGYESIEDVPKNKTRYYYLESVLSKAERKMLADAVKVHDIQVTSKLIREDDEVVYGDSGYLTIKCLFGYRKVAYKGLAKNENRLYALFASANLNHNFGPKINS